MIQGRFFTYVLLGCMLILVGIACQKQPPQNEQKTTTPTENSTTGLPPKSGADLAKLMQATDDIDIIFLSKSFSVNVSDRGAKAHISYISDQATQAVDCPEVSRMFPKQQGESLAHIGVFIGDNCGYYVFYNQDNDKREYINAMTQQGYNNFMQIINQVEAR